MWSSNIKEISETYATLLNNLKEGTKISEPEVLLSASSENKDKVILLVSAVIHLLNRKQLWTLNKHPNHQKQNKLFSK